MKMVKLLKRISQSNQIWVFIFENLRLAKYPRNWERIIMSDYNCFLQNAYGLHAESALMIAAQ